MHTIYTIVVVVVVLVVYMNVISVNDNTFGKRGKQVFCFENIFKYRTFLFYYRSHNSYHYYYIPSTTTIYVFTTIIFYLLLPPSRPSLLSPSIYQNYLFIVHHYPTVMCIAVYIWNFLSFFLLLFISYSNRKMFA